MDYRLIDPVLPQENLTVVERVLTNRGIKLDDVEHYLHTTDDDILPPETIARMSDGAKMLMAHIAANDKIFIQVDSDCDGYTSAALLINYLNLLFPGHIQNNISYRVHMGKDHGIIPETIPADVKLVIAPDSSSNDYEAHELLHNKGVDVLVIDHHEADKLSTYACVINNQLCDYPTKSLSGVGMVWKFCQYFDKISGNNYADEFRDLVAVGMIADMMDLRDFETRRLIDSGLKKIRNPFLKEMIKIQDYCISKDGGLHPHSVGFYIAPFVNAMTRFGGQGEKMTLFEAMLEYKAYEKVPSTKRGAKGQMETRVEQACRNCTNVRNHQNKSRDDAVEFIEELIQANNLLENKILIVKLDKKFAIDRNIAGLVANILANKYQRPCLILNKVEEDGKVAWAGSGRGFNQSSFTNFKDFLADSDLTYLAQGHQNAMGVGIYDDNIDKFIAYSNEALKDIDFTPFIRVDAIWDNANFNPREIIDLANLKTIWGQEVPEPSIAIENIKVHSGDCQLMAHNTLKISLQNGVSLIKFGVTDEEFEELQSEYGCVNINVVGLCKANVWLGKVSPQIEVQDYEITGAQEYYF